MIIKAILVIIILATILSGIFLVYQIQRTPDGTVGIQKENSTEGKTEEVLEDPKKLQTFEQPYESTVEGLTQEELSSIEQQVRTVIPPGVALGNISISPTPGKESEATVEISGVAETRNELLTFRSALKELPGFLDLDFPPENLLFPENVPFTMTLMLQVP